MPGGTRSVALTGGSRFGCDAKHARHIRYVVGRRGLVQRDADAAVAAVPEIDPGTLGCLPDLPDVSALDPQRVEIRRVGLTQAGRRQGSLEGLREPVNAFANRAKALGAVIHRVHRGDVGEERLRRADVGRGFLATNVLLAGLERHAVGALATRVHRHTDDPPRRLPNERVTRGKERGMRSAVAERDAESLRIPDDRVGAHLAWRHEQRERHQIGRDRDEHTGGSAPFR